MKKIKFHTFNNVEYTITWEILPNIKNIKVCGECDDPKSENPEIVINTNQTTKQLFITCLHESLHAQFYEKLSEKEIKKAENDIGEFLWKIFRKKLN